MSAIPATASPSLPDRGHLTALVGRILDEAKAQGATAAEAAVSSGHALSVTVRLGEVETLEHHRDRALAVTVYVGTRKGSASTADWGEAAVRDTVRAACDIARYTAEDPAAGLPDPQHLARDIPDLDLYHPWPVSVEQAMDLARDCEATARGLDTRIANSEGASVASQEGLTVYGNSHGFVGGYPSSRHSLSCSVIARDEAGMQRDHWYTISRRADELESPAQVGRHAAERALARLGSRRLGTRSVPVLFVPEQARGILGHYLSAVRGAALYRKNSFLVGSLGRPVFPEWLSLREEPHIPGALGSAPFDGEGVATRPHDLVRDGRVASYILDSYAARRLGLETTGNAGGLHNVLLEPSGEDFDRLLRRMDRGLVVTQLMGQGVNLLTGDYSRGASGFWVENGAIAHPVEEITIAGHLRDMFANLVAVGSDVDRRGAVRCGSLLVEAMTVAGE